MHHREGKKDNLGQKKKSFKEQLCWWRKISFCIRSRDEKSARGSAPEYQGKRLACNGDPGEKSTRGRERGSGLKEKRLLSEKGKKEAEESMRY